MMHFSYIFKCYDLLRKAFLSPRFLKNPEAGKTKITHPSPPPHTPAKPKSMSKGLSICFKKISLVKLTGSDGIYCVFQIWHAMIVSDTSQIEERQTFCEDEKAPQALIFLKSCSQSRTS